MLKDIFGNWKVTKKILYTLGFILLFRLGTLITIPGVTVNEAVTGSYTGSFLGILNMLGGGGLATFSLFALGVTPYITATIIIQLLSADVIPYLSRLKKQGEKGRIKLEKITRITTIFLAIIQGLAIILAMESQGIIYWNASNDILMVMYILIVMVAGSMIAIWIGDQITMNGVGNGTSLIIFSGIVIAVPSRIIGAWGTFVDPETVAFFVGLSTFMIYMLLAFTLIFIIGFFETSERRIPIQQTGQGLNLVSDEQTYLPIKVNPAGVVPVIFASAFLVLPPTIAQFFDDSAGKQWVIEHFSLTSPFGLTLYALLIIAFTYFYAHINIDPAETADNFQKSSTFIVGVEPGEPTRKYLSGIVNSVSTIGALELTIIAILPFVLTFFGVPQSVAFGGTGMIILISVAIDTWEQIKARAIAENTKKNLRVTTGQQKKSYKKFGEVKSVDKKNDENILFK